MLSVMVYSPPGGSLSRFDTITEAIRTAKHLKCPVTFLWNYGIRWTVKPDEDAKESYEALGKLCDEMANSGVKA